MFATGALSNACGDPERGIHQRCCAVPLTRLRQAAVEGEGLDGRAIDVEDGQEQRGALGQGAVELTGGAEDAHEERDVLLPAGPAARGWGKRVSRDGQGELPPGAAPLGVAEAEHVGGWGEDLAGGGWGDPVGAALPSAAPAERAATRATATTSIRPLRAGGPARGDRRKGRRFMAPPFSSGNDRVQHSVGGRRRASPERLGAPSQRPFARPAGCKRSSPSRCRRAAGPRR